MNCIARVKQIRLILQWQLQKGNEQHVNKLAKKINNKIMTKKKK